MSETNSERDFAQSSGSPGESPRLFGFLRVQWPVFLILLGAGYLLRAALPWPALSLPVIGLLFLILAGSLAASVLWSERRMGSFLKGARGEERVAKELGFLSSAFTVFHGMNMRQWGKTGAEWDYDHVVVGPTGVYVIETKNWAGPITIEGDEILYDGNQPTRPPIPQVRKAAEDLQNRILIHCNVDVPVQPVLCFASDALEGRSTGIRGVVVCNRSELQSVLVDSVEQPVLLEDQQRVIMYLNQQLKVDEP